VSRNVTFFSFFFLLFRARLLKLRKHRSHWGLLCILPLDFPALATSRLPRDPGSQRWNYVNLLVQVNIRMEQQLPSLIPTTTSL
jgi:hypothetical protein